MTSVERQDEIDRNLAYFLQELPHLLVMNGKFALLRNQSIIDYFDTITDAVKVGNARFDDQLFSVQEVSTVGSDLGYYSHAVHLGDA